ncbi:hypothetical protein R3P38DRAFT_2788668 [Favolaschia claudopus]|uniref:Uncharacterized protein n=1 Tax=Favolaschia claudopus TaxID=2862362 RepID=A0AAW0AKX7_9AGAR
MNALGFARTRAYIEGISTCTCLSTRFNANDSQAATNPFKVEPKVKVIEDLRLNPQIAGLFNPSGSIRFDSRWVRIEVKILKFSSRPRDSRLQSDTVDSLPYDFASFRLPIPLSTPAFPSGPRRERCEFLTESARSAETTTSLALTVTGRAVAAWRVDLCTSREFPSAAGRVAPTTSLRVSRETAAVGGARGGGGNKVDLRVAETRASEGAERNGRAVGASAAEWWSGGVRVAAAGHSLRGRRGTTRGGGVVSRAREGENRWPHLNSSVFLVYVGTGRRRLRERRRRAGGDSISASQRRGGGESGGGLRVGNPEERVRKAR